MYTFTCYVCRINTAKTTTTRALVDLCQGDSVPDPESGSEVQIPTTDANDFHNLTITFQSQTSVIKFMKIR